MCSAYHLIDFVKSKDNNAELTASFQCNFFRQRKTITIICLLLHYLLPLLPSSPTFYFYLHQLWHCYVVASFVVLLLYQCCHHCDIIVVLLDFILLLSCLHCIIVFIFVALLLPCSWSLLLVSVIFMVSVLLSWSDVHAVLVAIFEALMLPSSCNWFCHL